MDTDEREGKDRARIGVRFNAVEEFLAEIEKDAGQVERMIVRLTKTFRSLPIGMTEVAVVATAIVAGRLVRLKRPMGSVFSIGAPTSIDRSLLERADSIAKDIEQRVLIIGLDVRDGTYE